MSESDRLAEFHRIISDQLNARLAESPRFFWALVVVSTGYGYVLWNGMSVQEQAIPEGHTIVKLASILAFVTILWASWYLAALGYAFRFLQNSQHCIEHALGWSKYVPEYGVPPTNLTRYSDAFWLLPGIYHAHVFGLCIFLSIVVGTSAWQWWPSCIAMLVHLFVLAIGLVFIFHINIHYLRKFLKRMRSPESVPVVQSL